VKTIRMSNIGPAVDSQWEQSSMEVFEISPRELAGMQAWRSEFCLFACIANKCMAINDGNGTAQQYGAG
jgi:hypothetical protein